jgi:hypothetical protein
MGALVAAMFPDHQTAEGVRTRLVRDGFPTDRVELTSDKELGHAKVVPAPTVPEKLSQHFRQLFQGDDQEQSAQLLSRCVLEGRAVITVQPRGDVETQRAFEILEQEGPLALRERDLDDQTLERAAAPKESKVLPWIAKVMVPGDAR